MQDVKYFKGYQRFQILSVINCRGTFQVTEQNTMEKLDRPKVAITRFIISKLLYSMNNYDRTNKEMLYNDRAALFCVCWGKGKCCCYV